MDIRTSVDLVERVQHSRSPSRAKRRAARGLAQRFVTRPIQKMIVADGVIWMHPQLYRELRDVLAATAPASGTGCG